MQEHGWKPRLFAQDQKTIVPCLTRALVLIPDEEDKFMPKNFRAGVRPLPLDLSRAADPLGAPAESPQKAASPESPGSPDGSLDVFHAALPNLRTMPLHDAPDKANSLAHSDAGSTPKSALSIVSAFGMPR
jgi:hypothetical protein